MPGPLVSVIIPFLDPRDDFLRDAVASVEAQCYRPLELIFVNDGSAQSTVELAKRLADSVDLPARFIEHSGGANRGCSATRNLGASTARGEYLAFLDADDVWVSTKLGEQVDILRSDAKLAMVFGLTRYWYSWQQGDGSLPADFVVNRGVKRPVTMKPPAFVPLILRGRVIVPGPSNMMVRRDAYAHCGGFEETFRGMYEDQAFLVKLGLDHCIAGVPRHWDAYRQHPDQMTARAGQLDAERQARITFLTWVRQYCADKGMRAPEVWEAVNKEVWLTGATVAGSRTIRFRIAQRVKRWCLRLEELLLPAAMRQRLWGRPSV
jgi:glycosyltransferase involved in cell wall biosynthesis